MAFSSQRLFLRTPFHNEELKLPDRKRSDCQLKTYESCTDFRAWAMDPQRSAQYLLDVVHKARWPRKQIRPAGGLTRDYLLWFDTEELVDYVLCFMTELKEAKYELAMLQQVADKCEQKVVRQQSEVFDEERMREDLADLKDIIESLKRKADKYDCVERENTCLRKKVQSLCKERERNGKSSAIREDGGDSGALDCAKLQAQLCLYKNHFEELKVQKRTLMEELQRAKIGCRKTSELKNQLTQEQSECEELQRKLEDLQIKFDVQAIELQRKTNYITTCNKRLEEIESI